MNEIWNDEIPVEDPVCRLSPLPLKEFHRILVVGLGGIGTALVSPLCRYLAYSGMGMALPVLLFDGDDFQSRNRERQDFQSAGNKAQVKAREMRQIFPELSIRAVPEFMTPANVEFYIEDGDLVFLGVDNHVSRKIVSHRCQALKRAVVISGGNEWSDGNVQVHVRWDGQDLTSPLTLFHPEIEEATGPSGLFSCDAQAREGEPQLLFSNLAVASHMLNTLYAVVSEGLCYEEIYFDIALGKSEAISRCIGLGSVRPKEE